MSISFSIRFKLAISSVVMFGMGSYAFQLCGVNTIVKTRLFLMPICKLSSSDEFISSNDIANVDSSYRNDVMDTTARITVSTVTAPVDSAVTTVFTAIGNTTSPTTIDSVEKEKRKSADSYSVFEAAAMSNVTEAATAISLEAATVAGIPPTAATTTSTIISPEDFHIVSRVDTKDEIRHLEMYLKGKKGGIIKNSIIVYLY